MIDNNLTQKSFTSFLTKRTVFNSWVTILLFAVSSVCANAYTLKPSGTATKITCEDGTSSVQEGLMKPSSATKICKDHGGIRNIETIGSAIKTNLKVRKLDKRPSVTDPELAIQQKIQTKN